MTLDLDQHAAIEQYIAGELTGLNAAGIRDLAADYLRLRSFLELTMYDLQDWEGDGAEVGRGLTHLCDHLRARPAARRAGCGGGR